MLPAPKGFCHPFLGILLNIRVPCYIVDCQELGRRLEAAGRLVDSKVDTVEAREIVARLAERAGEKVDLIEVIDAEIERIVKVGDFYEN